MIQLREKLRLNKCLSLNLPMLKWFVFLKIFSKMGIGQLWNGKIQKVCAAVVFSKYKMTKLFFNAGIGTSFRFISCIIYRCHRSNNNEQISPTSHLTTIKKFLAEKTSSLYCQLRKRRMAKIYP